MENSRYFREKQKAFEEGNLQKLAHASRNLAAYFTEKGLFERALSEFRDEAATYKKLKNRMEEAKSHRMIGEMFMEMSKFNEALAESKIYLEVAQKEDKIEEQRALSNIGRCHLLYGQSIEDAEDSLNQLRLAEKSFKESLIVCQNLPANISKIEKQDMEARVYFNLGVTKEHMKNYEESYKLMSSAIQICKTNELFELLHECYITVGRSYQKQDDSAKSIKFFNLALTIAERFGQKNKKIVETLMFKAEAFIKTGDFQSSKQILQKAYKMKTTEEDVNKNIQKLLKVVAALCNTQDSLFTINSTNFKMKKELCEKMGDGSCQLQNYKMAIHYYLEMLKYADLNKESGKSLIPIYISLYESYKDNKQFDLALNYLWKEYELCIDEPKEAFATLLNIGDVYESSEKTFFETNEIYQRARKEASKLKNKKLEGIVFTRMIKLQKLNDMNTMAKLLEDEAKNLGIFLTNLIDSDEDSDEEENDQPDIGADICLDDLSDSSSDPELNNDGKHQFRKRIRTSVKKNCNGETQLHQACISGNLTLVRRLIDGGYSFKSRDNTGWLPLHEACIHGHKDIVELILDRGGISLINDRGGQNCEGITPIYDACLNGHLEVIELLLDRGANPTIRTDLGASCLSVLEKWKATAQLETIEALFYDTIHANIIEKFNAIGVSPNKRTSFQIDDDISTSDSDTSIVNLKKIKTNSRHQQQQPGPSNIGDDWIENDESEGLSLGFVKFMTFKIKVEDQILLVPVSMNIVNGLTIQWLANETARRYYNLNGLLPTIQLTTSDGAIFDLTDPISVAFSNKILSSVIVKFTIPPPKQCYVEACTSYNSIIVEEIKSSLENPEKVLLNDHQFSYNELQPLYKAIKYQNSLLEINLSSNFLDDYHIIDLANSLKTLRSLKVLNLSGNLITADGIESISLIWEKDSTIFLELTDLNLSYNPIRNKSLRFLSSICYNLKLLKCLNISFCEITNFSDENLNFKVLHEFNLSFNNLDIESIRKVLINLNSCQIKNLNLSFCSSEEGLAEHIAGFLSSGSCKNLHELNLSSCNLNDADICKILTTIPNSIILESLILSDNTQLTSISLKILINSKKIKYLNLSGCTKLLTDCIEVNSAGAGFPERIMLTFNPNKKIQQMKKLKQFWENRFEIKCLSLTNNVILSLKKPDLN